MIACRYEGAVLMRYDDPARPKSPHATQTALQVNGSPLPIIGLMYPMESEAGTTWRCRRTDGRKCFSHVEGPDCPDCARTTNIVWGWLCYIHAHIEGSTFGYHTAFVRSLEEFSREYMDDPERALAKWFKYEGPKPKRAATRQQVVEDLWEE
jgi:hypothetical protein